MILGQNKQCYFRYVRKRSDIGLNILTVKQEKRALSGR